MFLYVANALGVKLMHGSRLSLGGAFHFMVERDFSTLQTKITSSATHKQGHVWSRGALHSPDQDLDRCATASRGTAHQRTIKQVTV